MEYVIVTGADRGLGLELCRSFLEYGFYVFAGQYMNDWPELSTLLKNYPDTLSVFPLDVSDTASVTSFVAAVERITNRIDYLINNAAIVGNSGGLSEDMDLSKQLLTFNINTLGVIRMTEYVLPLMKEGKKRLCFISSEAGSISLCHREAVSFDYCMSKAGLNMSIRHMYNQLYPLGYTFRIYHPGWMRTYMSGKKSEEGLLDADESASAAIEQFIHDRDWENYLAIVDNEKRIWAF